MWGCLEEGWESFELVWVVDHEAYALWSEDGGELGETKGSGGVEWHAVEDLTGFSGGDWGRVGVVYVDRLAGCSAFLEERQDMLGFGDGRDDDMNIGVVWTNLKTGSFNGLVGFYMGSKFDFQGFACCEHFLTMGFHYLPVYDCRWSWKLTQLLANEERSEPLLGELLVGIDRVHGASNRTVLRDVMKNEMRIDEEIAIMTSNLFSQRL